MRQKIAIWITAPATPGILLLISGLLAIVVNNSAFSVYYETLLTTNIKISFGALTLNKPVLLWINDGLMAIFFLTIGLELKREVYEGNLSKSTQIALPVFAAAGGVILPAIIFFLFNKENSEALKGWAIPTATDIAFSLGILALLGKKVPLSLKILLTTIAVIDDLLAIVIIAAYYSEGLSYLSLFLAGLSITGLWALNLLGVKNLSPYIVLGIILWLCVLKSGVHATLTGVVLAFTIPLRVKAEKSKLRPVERLESVLNPWVSYGILPLFAFSNSGVSLKNFSWPDLLNPISLGIMLGLFIGKQCGVFGFAYLAVKLGIASLPKGIKWRHIFGVAILCGIGFTMSLLIGSLAYTPGLSPYTTVHRLGILIGSLFSAIAGYIFLRVTLRK